MIICLNLQHGQGTSAEWCKTKGSIVNGVSLSPLEVNASHSGGPGLYITLLPALLYGSSAGLQLADVCKFRRGEGGEQGEGGGPRRSLSPTCLSLNSVSLSAAGAGWEEFKGGNQNNT